MRVGRDNATVRDRAQFMRVWLLHFDELGCSALPSLPLSALSWVQVFQSEPKMHNAMGWTFLPCKYA
jgi:hypothetical protein